MNELNAHVHLNNTRRPVERKRFDRLLVCQFIGAFGSILCTLVGAFPSAIFLFGFGAVSTIAGFWRATGELVFLIAAIVLGLATFFLLVYFLRHAIPTWF